MIQHCCRSGGPCRRGHWKGPGVVDVLNGIDNTISGPAVVYQVNPAIAARAGFTPEEVATDAAAMLEGEPAATPVISNDRAFNIRVRYPGAEPRLAGCHEQYIVEQQHGPYRYFRFPRYD